MLLLVGLGNPGARYAGNRHNIGFVIVEAIAKRHGVQPWRRRFQGVAAEGAIGGEKVQLLLPGTFMNESGRAVAEAMHFYKLTLSEIVVFHDELALPRGKMRVRVGSSTDSGHNGLRSITAYIGSAYKRVRIGIGHPGDRQMVEHYVLSNFAKSELNWVNALTEAIVDNLELLAWERDSSFQNKVHLAMAAKGFGAADEKPAG